MRRGVRAPCAPRPRMQRRAAARPPLDTTDVGALDGRERVERARTRAARNGEERWLAAMAPVQILVTGDVRGKLGRLFKRVR